MSKKKATRPDFSKETIRENLTNNAQRILNDRGVNAHQFAKESGIQPLKVYRVLSGKSLPLANIIAEVAHALGVTVDELISKPKK